MRAGKTYLPCLFNEKGLGLSLENDVSDMRKINRMGSNCNNFCIEFACVSPKSSNEKRKDTVIQ